MIAHATVRSRLGRQMISRAGVLLERGTAGYPPKTRRRLRNTNIGCYVIAISCGLFALTFALQDVTRYRGAVLINLVMLVAALSTPALHRIHEVAGALFIAFVLLFSLFGVIALVGRESGIQINFIATSAMAFVIFELRRLRYTILLILTAIALHIGAWLLFREGLLPAPADVPFLNRLYVTTVVTISVIVAILVYFAFWTAEQAEAETESLLHRILPAQVAERLKTEPGAVVSDSFDEVAVLFSDIVGFVPIARSLGALRTVAMLNDLVHGFDRLASQHGVEKIKTIGDAYMAACGIPWPVPDSAARLARMALSMQAIADRTGEKFDVSLSLRIGIALGPVMAGVIGAQRFGYDIWGDAVNLAARLESSGKPRRIQVSKALRDALAEDFGFWPRGPREIKGLGTVETFFLTSAGTAATPSAASAG
jgi:adenylate cyclase